MKVYFAGPLFTPYVRDFLSAHAQIMRDRGIQPFVPHESFSPVISDERAQWLLAKGLISEEQLVHRPLPQLANELLRQGKVTREALGLSPMTPQSVFDRDMEGLASANAVVALLDGTQVDDGTACEIGIFHALSLRDPTKRGIAGFMTDSRALRRRQCGFGVNMFVLGVIEEKGYIFGDFADVLAQLQVWQGELSTLAEDGH